MKHASQNSPLRLFYQADGLASGQSVIFDIWDDAGNQLYDDIPATEIGAEGVYYLDITTPSSDLYLLAVGSNNHFYPQGEVVKVGSPNLKIWYIHGAFRSDQTIAYSIYNETGTNIQAGNLISVVTGFYYADAEGLPTPWFFEVPPLAIKNQDDLPAQ